MKKERLIYLPLGGAGEIGMNCYVYGYGPEGKERLILVDCGVTFPDMETSPGVDLILPDIAWLADRADRLEAIFITHAHEDHIGALAHLYSRLRAPVYTRRFTAVHAKRKMEETGQSPDAVTVVGPMPEQVTAGPFTVQFMPVSHSIPESSGLIIDSPAGRIVHTGDFKLDETPGLGEPFDRAAWTAVGDSGVKVLVCDSTNIFSPHPGRSEQSIAPAIVDLVSEAKGMVIATTFASNVSRLKTLAEAGIAAGRKVCFLGRAMKRMISAGVESGVMTDFPRSITTEEAQGLPRGEVMLIVTGSQGERRAASAQLARGKYLGLEAKEGDLFLFSSKTIPGNERGVIRIMNAYSEKGVDVVDDVEGLYHVSGHANRPDLQEAHGLLRPQILIPMHGEHRHMREHMRLAKAGGLASAIVSNGAMVDLTGDVPRTVEHIEAGRLYLDGTGLVGALDGVVRDRIRLALNGQVIVTMIIDEGGVPLGAPWADLVGLPEVGRSRNPLGDEIEETLATTVERFDRKTLRDDAKIEEALRRAVRQVAMDEIGKKPEVTVIVSRLLDD
jgi:ribonuclease J